MKHTKQELEDAVRQSFSFANVLRVLGIRQSGGSQCHIKRRIIDLGIDYSHFTGQAYNKGRTFVKKKASEILVKSDKNRREHAPRLRRSLAEIGIEYKCVKCGNTGEWQGQSLTLQVDHINNDWTDHRKDNLRFLCPNCHWQVSNQSAINKKLGISNKENIKVGVVKNQVRKLCVDCNQPIYKTSIRCNSCHCKKNGTLPRKSNIPPKEVLEKLVWEISSTKIAEMYQASDTAVKKWCKKYGIQKPGLGYWAKKKYNKL